jgi:hypothetical protein
MVRRDLILLTALALAAPVPTLANAQPVGDLGLLQGEWTGTLTYNDYSRPGRLVTLPTTLFAALASSTELTLHYIYDDGPGKTVHGYERMRWQPDGNAIVWAGGGAKPFERSYTIVSARQERDLRQIVFERTVEAKKDRYTLEIGPASFSLRKEELDGGAAAVFRNEYTLRRAGR